MRHHASKLNANCNDAMPYLDALMSGSVATSYDIDRERGVTVAGRNS